MIHLKVLGPVEILITSGDSRERLRVLWPRIDEMFLRALAVRLGGFRTDELMTYFSLATAKPIHDAASRIRKTLRDHGFDLSNARPSYRILRDGEPVKFESDIAALATSAGMLEEFENQDWSSGPPEGTTLDGDLKRLDQIVDGWAPVPGRSSRPARAMRALKLGLLVDFENDRLLIDLDDRVRAERARRAVAFAKQIPSTPRVERARRALDDYDAPAPEHVTKRASYKEQLRKIAESLQTQEHGMTDVFLAAPMEAAGNYVDGRAEVMEIIAALQDHCGVDTVFFAGDDIDDPEHFESPSVGLGRNMPYFRSATRFLMVYPEKAASGVLVEAGLALALGASSVYFVKDREDLPWVLRDPSGANDMKLGPVRIFDYRDHSDLLAKIKSNGRHLFPPVRS